MDINRRGFMVACGLAAIPFKLGAAVRSGMLELSYDRPAGPWIEALPVGNGRLGAMVFGGVRQERIQINKDTLWAGSPYDPNNPEAAANLQTVRDLIDRGDFKQASDLAGAKLMAQPIRQMPYGAAGDLLIDFIDAQEPISYERTLDLRDAIHRTSHRSGKGVFEREVFVSPVAQVLVVRLRAPAGQRLNLDIQYRHPDRVEYGATSYDGATGASRLVGAAWDHREPLKRDRRPADLAIGPDGADALLITGTNASAEGIAAGLRYAVRVRAVTDGRIAADGESLRVRGSDTVTLYVSAATSFVSFRDVTGDPVARVRRDTDAAALRPFEQLKAEHVRSHRDMFDRFHIELGAAASPEETTDRRIARSPERDDPQLAALYVQYARYLLLSSSREGTQPANLQGIWNEGLNPPWGSKYTININTQMNYWPAGPGNLVECIEPLLRMVEDLAVTGAVTARSMYGARGWAAHHNTDLWRATAPIDGPLWGMWPSGGAWLCTTLWDYYDYTRDSAVLSRLYPLLRDAALFFVDALVEDPKGRGLVTSPSISPENVHPHGVAICAGPAMDRQILRDLFDFALTAHERLGRRARDGRGIRRAQAPAAGSDRGAGPDSGMARGLGRARARATTPSRVASLRRISQRAVERARHARFHRGRADDAQYAWRPGDGLGHGMAAVPLGAHGARRARLSDSQGTVLGPERTYPNMFDAHPPFQIDGNFGGAAGIMEMILQSWGDEIHLLPALPKAWTSGRVSGMRVRGGATANLAWDDGRLVSAKFKGRSASSLSLRYGGKLHVLKLDGDGVGRLSL